MKRISRNATSVLVIRVHALSKSQSALLKDLSLYAINWRLQSSLFQAGLVGSCCFGVTSVCSNRMSPSGMSACWLFVLLACTRFPGCLKAYVATRSKLLQTYVLTLCNNQIGTHDIAAFKLVTQLCRFLGCNKTVLQAFECRTIEAKCTGSSQHCA